MVAFSLSDQRSTLRMYRSGTGELGACPVAALMASRDFPAFRADVAMPSTCAPGT